MPLVQMHYDEAEGDLPDVCLRCGRLAVCRVKKTIRLHDTASGYGRGVVALIMLLIDLNRHFSGPTLVLRGPFCGAHRGHWAFRRALLWSVSGLLPILLLGTLALYLAGAIGNKAALAFCFVSLFGCILSAALIYGSSTVKFGSNQTTETLILSHVHPRFIAVLLQRREERTWERSPKRRMAPTTASRLSPPTAVVDHPPEDHAAPFARLDEPTDERPRSRPVRRRRAGNPNLTALLVSLLVGVPIILLVLLGAVIRIGRLMERISQPPAASGQQAPDTRPEEPREEDRDVEPGTLVPNAPARPPLPAELAGRPSIDLIPLMNLRKDVVHGRWLVADKVLHCNDGSFVPRVQFPYLPPEEYDFVVTFLQPELRNGISLVMPNPNGGSFFWFLGSEEGQGYGFHSNPDKGGRIPRLIKANTICTTVVQVRKGSVRALLDGKELIRLKTSFRDLTCDDWRRIHNTKYLAVACDDPTVFYHVRITEVTGRGKKGR
jgi:hypothetical protein